MIDKLLSFTLDLNRFEANTRIEVLKILNKAQKELLAKIALKDLTNFNKARTARLLKESRDIISSYYERAQMDMIGAMEELPEVVARNTMRALESKLPPSIEASFPPENVLKTLTNDTLVMGSVAKDWWAKQAADTTFRYNGAVRQGLALGETNLQIAKRVRQVMDVSRRNAASLVQTSTASVANNARQATFEENEDVLRGYRWVTALDSRVCELCIARSDKEWTTKGEPIGHGIPFQVPGLHFNDRCILTAVTKSFEELGVKGIKAPRPGQRASEDGPVSSKTTFDDFLKRKGEAWQDEVLGKGRAELWRKGVINLEDLISGDGRPLTLQQLKARHS